MVFALLSTVALAAAPEFSFAFSNESGSHLLALPPVAAPAKLNAVVCDGRLLDVKYVGEQAKGPKDSGRQTAGNFSQVKGSLFKLMKGTMPADALCLLAPAAAFSKRKLVPVTAASGEKCDEKTAALMAQLGKRAVTKCLPTGTFPGARLTFAGYELDGSSALAAMALTEDTGASVVRKFPATWERGAPSCWRADDGCEFDPSSYRVAFAMSGPAGLELYALWAGPEGENAELLRVKGSELSVAATASRYWSPE